MHVWAKKVLVRHCRLLAHAMKHCHSKELPSYLPYNWHRQRDIHMVYGEDCRWILEEYRVEGGDLQREDAKEHGQNIQHVDD